MKREAMQRAQEKAARLNQYENSATAIDEIKRSPFFFASNYIVTYNETTKRNERYPDYPFLRDKVFSNIHAPGNRLWEKSQRMLVTISFCVYYLWAWMTEDGFAGWFTSRKQDNVDDGGSASTWKSLMGKIRFYYNGIVKENPWIIEHFLGSVPESGRLFKFMTLQNPKNDNLIIGEAPTPDSPTGEGYSKAFVDEAARVPRLYNIHGNLMLACPQGTHYVSYPNGRANKFAEIRFAEGHFGFEIVTINWQDHPERDENWFRLQASSMNQTEIAMRLLISYADSTVGRIFKSFRRDKNLVFSLSFDINSVELSWDFGATDATSVGILNRAFIEKNGRRLSSVKAKDWVEIENTNYVEVSKAVHAKLIAYGFAGGARKSYDDMTDAEREAWHKKTLAIHCVGDKQVNAKMVDTGITLRERYRSMGFNIEATVHHETKAVLEEIDKWMADGRLIIDDQATEIIDCAESWTWPLDSKGNPVVGATQPAHNRFSHAGKSLEYWFASEMMENKANGKSLFAAGSRTQAEAMGAR